MKNALHAGASAEEGRTKSASPAEAFGVGGKSASLAETKVGSKW